jgi:hypothetical protein
MDEVFSKSYILSILIQTWIHKLNEISRPTSDCIYYKTNYAIDINFSSFITNYFVLNLMRKTSFQAVSDILGAETLLCKHGTMPEA